jgi:hypothetical protein
LRRSAETDLTASDDDTTVVPGASIPHDASEGAAGAGGAAAQDKERTASMVEMDIELMSMTPEERAAWNAGLTEKPPISDRHDCAYNTHDISYDSAEISKGPRFGESFDEFADDEDSHFMPVHVEESDDGLGPSRYQEADIYAESDLDDDAHMQTSGTNKSIYSGDVDITEITGIETCLDASDMISETVLDSDRDSQRLTVDMGILARYRHEAMGIHGDDQSDLSSGRVCQAAHRSRIHGGTADSSIDGFHHEASSSPRVHACDDDCSTQSSVIGATGGGERAVPSPSSPSSSSSSSSSLPHNAVCAVPERPGRRNSGSTMLTNMMG